MAATPPEDRPKLPRSVTLAAGNLGVARSIRKALREQGKGSVAEQLVEVSDDRPMRDVPFPETGRLDTNVVFDDQHRPAHTLLRSHFIKEGLLVYFKIIK